MALRNQDFVIESIPATGPVLVGPADAEGKIRSTRAEHRVERLLQERLAAKPVVVIAESIDTMRVCELSLTLAHVRIGKVVITELTGFMGLPVTRKQRPRAAHI